MSWVTDEATAYEAELYAAEQWFNAHMADNEEDEEEEAEDGE